MSEMEGLTFSEKLEDKLHRTGQFQQIFGFFVSKFDGMRNNGEMGCKVLVHCTPLS